MAGGATWSVGENGELLGEINMPLKVGIVGGNLDANRGAGLGLAITQRIVELHGGRIKVTSRDDKGSVFEFFLPVERACEDRGAAGENDYSYHP